ncbi:hypothetical protein V6N12_015733 [Hibiscus sabdariffa]|uniref:RNase H type-1 domain-containing protein n=1 Tax=Hibiscus sabdariffa TaxID=183260 RepID=A0ABR2DS16_9ROSI
MSKFSLIPFVVIWFVWLARNEVVFNKKGIDWLHLDFLVRVRLVTWVKAKFSGCDIPLDCLISHPSLALNLCKNPKGALISGRWCPLSWGFLKLNVDEALSSCFEGGIGGLLRDEKDKIFFQFSEPAGNGPPVLMELLVLRVRIRKFLNSSWVNKFSFIVESDCKQVVDWISSQVGVPYLFASFISEIAGLISRFGFVLRLIPRLCNAKADKLANMGIG